MPVTSQIEKPISSMSPLPQSASPIASPRMQMSPAVKLKDGDVSGLLDLRSFRVAKEFEDEETAFQRKTTKIAIDVARAETELAIQKANVVWESSSFEECLASVCGCVSTVAFGSAA